MITTELLLIQPVAVMVSVRLYVVVTVGDTLGFEALDVKPAGDEVQLYVSPVTAAAPMLVELPVQMACALPALATGSGFTVTVMLLEAEQPVALMVSVSVYVVIAVGDTVGLDEAEVKPAGLEVQL